MNPGSLTRRQALRLGAGALLSLGLWPGRTEAADEGWFRFLVVNDTHHMSPECGPWLEKVVRQMQSHAGVEFCLVAGDLTEHGQREHLGAMREILSKLGVPVHVQPGNHDYASETDRGGYDAVFPNQLNYAFQHRGWQFVGLDSTEGQKYQQTRVQPATLAWLDAELPKLDRRRPVVVFTHFPLGAGVTYRPLNADAVLERFLEHDLRAVFSGHFHGFTQRGFRNAHLTTNKCCALKRGNHDNTKEKGYFLCTVEQGVLAREFIEV